MSLYNENIKFLKENYSYVKWDEEHELESNVHEICAIMIEKIM